MRRRTFIAATSGLLAACTVDRRGTPAPPMQRGIAFDSFRARAGADDFAAVRTLGATHVALFPFGFMRRHDEPRVLRFDGRGEDWSLTDEGLHALAGMARAAGLRVVLIPTLVDFVDGHWRGEVRMTSAAAWDEWFDSYRAFLFHYADLAEQVGAVGLSVGTELRLTVLHADDWRRTISGVRERFRGWLTYAANWDDYDTVPWWDAVDLIGVQAYFELGDPGNASVAERRAHLVRAWAPIKERLADVSRTTGRRVLFTEIGYKSHTGATAQPWKWEIEGETDVALQRAAYEAVFDAFWTEPWFAGMYWWKWHPDPTRRRDHLSDFTPQGKPAEAVIRQWYSADDTDL